ncbi:DNA methyltransferase [Clostridium beijerinckii]|uniref:DNA methyltransferase n=1 Tax=Clostridium beijerinckii TaxID=1520 RepID=UPI000809D912|nr:DNA methyltransferase [Clostridium beijerinckii]OCA97839.1 modification methylase [Clostridium beijerinckii]
MLNKKIIVDELPSEIKEHAIYEINQPNPNSYTHNYFKYPCKFIPEIPRWAIKTYLNSENIKQKRILDPFAGSGTTLLEASLMGLDSVGTEIDEIAKLIIKVKTTQLTEDEIQTVKSFTLRITRNLEENKFTDNEITLPYINNLEHWFNENALRGLGYLYNKILAEIDNEKVRDFLLISMAGIIKRVSNADDISPKPYVSNKVIKNPPAVAKSFLDTIEKNISGMITMKSKEMGNVVVRGDALHIPESENTIDLAITSPPYINAFDYVRTLRLENLWLQLSTEDELREKKKNYLGTESINVKKEKENTDILSESDLLKKYYQEVQEVDEKRALIIKRFFEDMKKNLEEVYRVLKPGGYYGIVIGNSKIRNVDIESWKVLNDIGQDIGFKYETHFAYSIKNPYIRIPRANKGGKISLDHILVLVK